MKKTSTIVVIIIILLILIVGGYLIFSSGKSGSTQVNVLQSPLGNTPTSNSPTFNPSTNQNSPDVTSNVSVSISNFSFNPATLNIRAGTTVTWTNNDSVAHTVTSDSGNLLNSPTLSPGQSFNFTFNNIGSFSYHCAIHSTMRGNIVVGN